MTRPWPTEKHRPKRRIAAPGELFRLVVDRDPGASKGPISRRTGKPKRILSLSVNDWDHVHWRVREKLRKEIDQFVWAAIAQQRPPAFTEGRPYVLIAYYFRRRARRDWGNWTGKHLVDALVTHGVLTDDSDTAIDLDRPLLLVDPQRPRVEFWIADTTVPLAMEDAARLNALKRAAQAGLPRMHQPKRQSPTTRLPE